MLARTFHVLAHASLILAAHLVFSSVGLGELSNQDYVDQCEAAGVVIPQKLSCADAEELPVFRSTCEAGNKTKRIQITMENFELLVPNGECDHPALVQRNNPRVGCLPGARISWTESKQNATVCSIVCRRTNNSTPLGYFQDVSLICHNPKNGATCFFNSKVESLEGEATAGLKSHSGENIPSPKETNNQFWMKPRELEIATCTHCHDHSPFLTTPNLGAFGERMRARLSELSTGRYTVIGSELPFSSPLWKNRYVLAEPNSCTSCHEIGAGKWGSCGYLRDTAVGQNSNLPQTTCNLQQGWMPPPKFHGNKLELLKDITRIRNCCRDFDQHGQLKKHPDCLWNLK